MTAVPQVDPRDVPAGATIIDVREDYEWEGGHATGAKHITLSTLADRLAELPHPAKTSTSSATAGAVRTARQPSCADAATRPTTLLAAPAHGSPPVCR